MSGIVVRMPPTGQADALLTWADAHAQLSGDKLRLVTVWPRGADIEVDLPPGAFPPLQVGATCQVTSRKAEVVLLESGPRVVVVSGAPRLDRLDRHLMRDAQCPVVFVPPISSAPHGRIAVGVCSSSSSRPVLAHAIAQAKLMSAELIVVEARQFPLARIEQRASISGNAHDQHVAGATERLRQWVSHESDGSSLELQVVHGPPLEALLHAADNADMLILGRHLHGIFARLLHGTLGAEITKHAMCPVMLVPS